MPVLVFATRNPGKVRELAALVGPEVELLTPADFPGLPEVDEDQPTFAGNAVKKARQVAASTGRWALADDSGLCVDALGGAPGVHSARYAPTEAARIEKLLAAMAGVADRSARFECALALCGPGGELHTAAGTCEGHIGHVPRGADGFGYDPLFVLPDGRTLAETSLLEKSTLSHRARAFAAMRPRLLAALGLTRP